MNESPLVLINAVGLTSRLLPLARRLKQLAERGWHRPVEEVIPAVTSTVQASILTGKSPQEHGIVANGWLFRDTREIRFWQQANSLLDAEPFYRTLRQRRAEQGRPFKVAKLFWWFNQGADVDLSLTPKPHYGCDGSKAFDITGTPDNLSAEVKGMLGPFPFPAFWGPMAGALSSRWIARSAAHVLDRHRPDLTLVYLPHLDYDPQRFGPSGCDMARQVAELDDACAPILETAERTGARVWVVSEYGHVDVDRPVEINRHLRREGLFVVRDGPFGEMLDTFASRAIAVCDHQLAHVYVRQKNDVLRVADGIRSLAGVARVLVGPERAELNLDHPRSGEIIALSDPRSWFAYPYWLDDARAPDFARTVDIHRKPGFDPCEMFFDPTLRFPKARVARRLIAKKLGFRATLDVIPLDTGLVKGSHGLAADDPLDRPLLIADGPAPTTASITFREVYERLLTFDTA